MKTWAERELLIRLDRLRTGEVGLLETCRQVAEILLIVTSDLARSEAARVLVGVASEVEDLPIGQERLRWDVAALARLDAQAEVYEAEVRDAVLAASKELAERIRALGDEHDRGGPEDTDL